MSTTGVSGDNGRLREMLESPPRHNTFTRRSTGDVVHCVPAPPHPFMSVVDELLGASETARLLSTSYFPMAGLWQQLQRRTSTKVGRTTGRRCYALPATCSLRQARRVSPASGEKSSGERRSPSSTWWIRPGNPPFDALDKPKRVAVEKELIEKIHDCAVFGFSVTVSEPEHDEIISRSPSLGGAYSFCLRGCSSAISDCARGPTS